MNGIELSNQVLPTRRGIVARAYSPRGSYWRQPFVQPEALYINEGDFVFIAARYDNTWQNDCEYYSEIDLLEVEEVRLLSALTLPLPIDGGIVAFHPMPLEVRIPENLDLSARSSQLLVSRELRRHSKSDQFASHDYLRLPPAWGGSHAYDVRDGEIPLSLKERMFRSIDIADHLLIRGLNALLRCNMLRQYGMFFEEATYALYVGLDASFALVRRRMILEGWQNPSAYDAAAWIDAAFNHPYGGYRYFEDFYNDRVRALHGESRFGVFPFAPLAADDCYDLFHNLREVYNLLIFGEVVERPCA